MTAILSALFYVVSHVVTAGKLREKREENQANQRMLSDIQLPLRKMSEYIVEESASGQFLVAELESTLKEISEQRRQKEQFEGDLVGEEIKEQDLLSQIDIEKATVMSIRQETLRPLEDKLKEKYQQCWQGNDDVCQMEKTLKNMEERLKDMIKQQNQVQRDGVSEGISGIQAKIKTQKAKLAILRQERKEIEGAIASCRQALLEHENLRRRQKDELKSLRDFITNLRAADAGVSSFIAKLESNIHALRTKLSPIQQSMKTKLDEEQQRVEMISNLMSP